MRHTEGTFDNGCSGGLYYQVWTPDSPSPGTVILVHGLAEHSGRYQPVAERLVRAGFTVRAFDQRGHGRSPGQRCYVNSFEDLTSDLNQFIQASFENHPGRPLFLMGHSLGALEVAAYLTTRPKDIAGAVISGIPLDIEASLPRILVKLADVFSALVPRLGIRKLPSTTISRESQVVRDYVNDPLVHTGRIPARMGAELMRTVRQTRDKLRRIRAPLLILHGGGDRMAAPAGSRLLYQMAGSSDKELKIMADCYHEVYNEACRDEVLNLVIDWLNRRRIMITASATA
jgi:alpha-beta hydrolase superfamily lysophospholipase